MTVPDKRIIRFIRRHHVLTLATAMNGRPWCANCFYVYIPDKNELVFTSDEATRHVRELLINPLVAGTIVLETKWVGKIRGLQFTGSVRRVTNDLEPAYRKAYIKRFPYASAIKKLDLWILTFDHLKYTDNRLGFGIKLMWP